MKNKIIELAQEAGFMLVTGDAFDENAWFECFPSQIERFAGLVRQDEREGWRWASECEAEVVRVTDLNQRLMSGAQELRDATDAAEFDEAWSKLFALFKEAI